MCDEKLAVKLLREIADDIEAGASPKDSWHIKSLFSGEVMSAPSWDEVVARVLAAPDLILRKPRTITVNGVEVPEPLREMEVGQVFWLAVPADPESNVHYKFCGDSIDHRWLRDGLCRATRAACELHIEAMLKPSREVSDE